MTTVAMILGWVCLFTAASGIVITIKHAKAKNIERATTCEALACGWAIAAALMWMVAR